MPHREGDQHGCSLESQVQAEGLRRPRGQPTTEKVSVERQDRDLTELEGKRNQRPVIGVSGNPLAGFFFMRAVLRSWNVDHLGIEEGQRIGQQGVDLLSGGPARPHHAQAAAPQFMPCFTRSMFRLEEGQGR